MIYKKPSNGKFWVAGKGTMGKFFKGMKTIKNAKPMNELQNIRSFESFINEAAPEVQPKSGHDLPDPWSDLKGNDLKVFEMVEQLMSSLTTFENIESALDRKKMEPLITSIVAQRKFINSGWKSPDYHKSDKEFYIFVNNGFEIINSLHTYLLGIR